MLFLFGTNANKIFYFLMGKVMLPDRGFSCLIGVFFLRKKKKIFLVKKNIYFFTIK
jgi:hypothetical protein